MKRSPMKRRRGPRRRKAPQADAEWWEWADAMLRRRAGGACEHCGRPLGRNVERHHRIRRRDGGDRLSNLLLLNRSCHAYLTEHPDLAYASGWSIRALAGRDPSEVPVRMGLAGNYWLLDDEGGRRLVA